LFRNGPGGEFHTRALLNKLCKLERDGESEITKLGTRRRFSAYLFQFNSEELESSSSHLLLQPVLDLN
jgi:hypothetical protein